MDRGIGIFVNCLEKKKKRQRTTRITRNAGRVRNVSTKMHVFWVGGCFSWRMCQSAAGKKELKKEKRIKKEKLAAPVVDLALGSDSWSWAWVEATSCLIPFAMPCAALMSVNIKRSGVITFVYM